MTGKKPTLGPIEAMEAGNGLIDRISGMMDGAEFTHRELSVFLSTVSTALLAAFAETLHDGNSDGAGAWIDMVAGVTKRKLGRKAGGMDGHT